MLITRTRKGSLHLHRLLLTIYQRANTTISQPHQQQPNTKTNTNTTNNIIPQPPQQPKLSPATRVQNKLNEVLQDNLDDFGNGMGVWEGGEMKGGERDRRMSTSQVPISQKVVQLEWRSKQKRVIPYDEYVFFIFYYFYFLCYFFIYLLFFLDLLVYSP